MIEARPVTYKGVRTRSVLEGRWLVFFSTLGVEWQYEPEDFSLPSRGYRPDLWLPGLEVWAEIKPPHTPLDHQLTAAIQEDTGSPLLWIAGEPRQGGYSIALCDFGGVEVIENLRFALSHDGALWLADEEQTCRVALPPSWVSWENEWSEPFDNAKLEAAYQAAMSHRFPPPVSAGGGPWANREALPGRHPPRIVGETNPDR